MSQIYFENSNLDWISTDLINEIGDAIDDILKKID